MCSCSSRATEEGSGAGPQHLFGLEDLLRHIRGSFALWFHWVDQRSLRLAPLAQELWNLLQAGR
jgi:hypothetical protein